MSAAASPTGSEADPRFVLVSEALASYAGDPDDPPLPGEGSQVRAAVSLVLRGAGDLELLLIKRAQSEGDPWSGHMALPGGRTDPSDRSLVETAIRETREETGIHLDRGGRRLGRLTEVRPFSRHLPRLEIFPFVFGVDEGTSAHAASAEVERVLWTPVDLLRDPAVRDAIEIPSSGEARSFPGFRVEGEIVWGLTYRILTEFLEAYPLG